MSFLVIINFSYYSFLVTADVLCMQRIVEFDDSIQLIAFMGTKFLWY